MVNNLKKNVCVLKCKQLAKVPGIAREILKHFKNSNLKNFNSKKIEF